jgi:type I restriction enzyme, S subunit
MWGVARLRDLCDVITKGTTPTSVGHAFTSEGINFVKVESISDCGAFIPNKIAHVSEACHNDLKRSQLRHGDILFSIAGALGRSALVTEEITPANTNQALAIIRLRNSDGIVPKFVLKALETETVQDQIGRCSGGVAQQNLSLAQVGGFTIPVPPLTEQQRIVSILDDAFGRIAIAKDNAERNLQNAHALFESHLQSVFANHRKGWVEKQLSELCDVKHGFAFDGGDFANDLPDGNPVVITPGNFTEDGRLIFNEKNTKRFNGKPPAEFHFDVGDLVIVMTDLSSKMKILGKPAFVETNNILHNQRIGRLVFFNDCIEKRLLYYFMMTEEFLRNIKGSATGTMVKHTAPKRILSNVISFPENRQEQRAIISKLDAVREDTRCLESIYQHKLLALEGLKKSVLQAAFTGKL